MLAAELRADQVDATDSRGSGPRADPEVVETSGEETIGEPNRHIGLAVAATGRDLQRDPAIAMLADTLAKAEAAGWSLDANLPAVVAQAPLSDTLPAQDLAYRVMDAVPDAVPALPSVGQINVADPQSSGSQRKPPEPAVLQPPTTDRPPTVGR